MRLADIDYDLPDSAIAQAGVEPRDSARLLVVEDDGYAHIHVRDLPGLLGPGDVVVANETRVRPARVLGHKTTGGRAEVLFLRPAADGWWEALVRPARRLSAGSLVHAGPYCLEVGPAAGDGSGRRLVRAAGGADVPTVMAAVGEVPLPPYVNEPLTDRERYQTVYGRNPASAAAPTAGLHFTPELLARLRGAGVGWATVDLEVGMDTFAPVREEDPADHRIHTERWSVPAATAAAVAAATRVVAVGTTTVRALESAAAATGAVEAGASETGLYILPGYRFRAVDLLLTNFHAPRSTLLGLLAAVMGERWRDAYAVALAEGYRFLSLGDAMLVPVPRG